MQFLPVAAAAALVLAAVGAVVALTADADDRPPKGITTAPPEVPLTLSNERVHNGRPIEARFDPLPASGTAYWATIAARGSSDEMYGVWAWVGAGATSVSLLPPNPGEFELRLHSSYPARPTNVVGRAPFTVLDEVMAARELEDRALYAVGDRAILRFEAPLAAEPSERFWVTVAPADSTDDTWGTWHYVESGATSATVHFTGPGRFEVRLHDGYPRLPHHVILRRRVEVR